LAQIDELNSSGAIEVTVGPLVLPMNRGSQFRALAGSGVPP
jgi:hypothetical protein